MKGKRVLVVDDEPHLTYILSFKLQQLGLEVITAADGEEALALALAQTPDLVITDYQMPTMSGLNLCIKLRETPQTADVPVIMLTARGHRLLPSELAKTNIQHLIPKPFSARDLISRADEMLRANAGAAGDPGASGLTAP